MADPVRVFISYSSKDADLVDRLKTALAQAGVDVWLDHEQLTPDTPDWRAAVVKGIEQATNVIYSASPDAADSEYVGHELAIARDEGKRILPFWVHGEKWSRCVPMGYHREQYIDGRDAAYVDGLTKLLATLRIPSSTGRPANEITTILEPRSEGFTTSTQVTVPPFPDEDDDFQATAFYPRVAKAGMWDNTLLVYAHVASALGAVRDDAIAFERAHSLDKSTTSQRSGPLPPGTEITLEPKVGGVRFDPEKVTLKWTETWHRALFRFKPAPELADDVAKGMVQVYATTDAGPLPICTVKLAMSFEESPTYPLAANTRMYPGNESSGYRFQRVFASYAHEDADIVQRCRDAYQAIGITMFIDYISLLSGQDFPSALHALIDAADVFQLYWSPHAAASFWVRREWEYALRCRREEGFIRPVYWADPLPTVPLELRQMHFARLAML